MPVRRRTTRAFRAGQHVHNFFAVIGTAVATAAVGTKNTIRDFAVGVKEGGPAEQEEKRKEDKAPRGATTA